MTEIDKGTLVNSALLEFLEREQQAGNSIAEPGVIFQALRAAFLGTISDMDIRWSVGTLLAENKILYTFDGKFKLLFRGY